MEPNEKRKRKKELTEWHLKELIRQLKKLRDFQIREFFETLSKFAKFDSTCFKTTIGEGFNAFWDNQDDLEEAYEILRKTLEDLEFNEWIHEILEKDQPDEPRLKRPHFSSLSSSSESEQEDSEPQPSTSAEVRFSQGPTSAQSVEPQEQFGQSEPTSAQTGMHLRHSGPFDPQPSTSGKQSTQELIPPTQAPNPHVLFTGVVGQDGCRMRFRPRVEPKENVAHGHTHQSGPLNHPTMTTGSTENNNSYFNERSSSDVLRERVITADVLHRLAALNLGPTDHDVRQITQQCTPPNMDANFNILQAWWESDRHRMTMQAHALQRQITDLQNERNMLRMLIVLVIFIFIYHSPTAPGRGSKGFKETPEIQDLLPPPPAVIHYGLLLKTMHAAAN